MTRQNRVKLYCRRGICTKQPIFAVKCICPKKGYTSKCRRLWSISFHNFCERWWIPSWPNSNREDVQIRSDPCFGIEGETSFFRMHRCAQWPPAMDTLQISYTWPSCLYGTRYLRGHLFIRNPPICGDNIWRSGGLWCGAYDGGNSSLFLLALHPGGLLFSSTYASWLLVSSVCILLLRPKMIVVLVEDILNKPEDIPPFGLFCLKGYDRNWYFSLNH